MKDYPLVNGDHALAIALGLSISTVRRWRDARLIPYIKTGHRSIAYSLAKVLSALEKLEVQALTKGGTR
jgi:hypothetical protein